MRAWNDKKKQDCASRWSYWRIYGSRERNDAMGACRWCYSRQTQDADEWMPAGGRWETNNEEKVVKDDNEEAFDEKIDEMEGWYANLMKKQKKDENETYDDARVTWDDD